MGAAEFYIDYTPDRLSALRLMIDLVTTGIQSALLSFSEEMNPTDYESMVAAALAGLGWTTQLTGGSGDQGIDMIASMRGKRVVIQCKRYTSAVGNSAVQEVFAGRAFVCADFAAVVSSAGFTRSAVELAERTNVVLLHHDDLAFLERQIFGACFADIDPIRQGEPRQSIEAQAAEILRLTPSNYEQFVAEQLSFLGWKAIHIADGVPCDIDVIAEKDGFRVVIYCLGFFAPVDSGYVQCLMQIKVNEGADLAVIVSDQEVTDAAFELASITGVILLSHYNLSKLDLCIEDIKSRGFIASGTDFAAAVIPPTEPRPEGIYGAAG